MFGELNDALYQLELVGGQDHFILFSLLASSLSLLPSLPP
jgi:hypothetical protein